MANVSLMDILRQDIRNCLRDLRTQLPLAREAHAEGPGRWQDEDGRTAQQIWAGWALVSTRNAQTAIAALDLPMRRELMTADERAEVDVSRAELSDLHSTFVRMGGHLLPGDMPPL